MNGTAILFTGQGSQFTGMGRDLVHSAAAKSVLDEAEQVLPGINGLMLNGPESLLNATENTQPAVYVFEMALWAAFKARWPEAIEKVSCLAGHSLGEYSALTAAGALTFGDGLRLVMARGAAMRDAGQTSPGGMLVVLGMAEDQLNEMMRGFADEGQTVWVANLNAPGQVVLAGTHIALTAAQQAAMARGARRCIPLAVSVACHTPLMQSASEALALALAGVTIAPLTIPVVSNVEARPLKMPDEVRSALLRQLSSPVRWIESVEAMRLLGVTKMIELGPKTVLAGLVQRINQEISVCSVTNLVTLDALTWEDR